ncbi:MAG: SusF/SusE family outer membrane protein [Paludibacter sp.]|nr:SusF/SusE family outer membrane protein [Paludibacter sp.]
MKTFNKILVAVILSVPTFFTSCTEDMMETSKGDNALVLSTNTDDSVSLDVASPTATAIKFSWTSGSNQGTNAAITYEFQLGKVGDNFSNAIDTVFDKGSVSIEYTNEDFNNILLNHFGVAVGSKAELEARIIAIIHANGIEPDTSAVINMSVTSYKPISKTLYIIGSAAPNGWSADNATKMNSVSGAAGSFTWQGHLSAGELKFITTLGSFVPSYNKGADNTSLYFRESDSDPDNKFTISSSGIYKITLNIITLAISIDVLDAPEYSQLWFVGGFSGWNFVEMRNDLLDPYVFHYNAELSSTSSSDEFKIATAQSFDDNVIYFHPAVDQQGTGTDLTVAKWSAAENADDYKWKINTGVYKITFDLQNMKIDIVPFTPYSSMYMIGSATSVGWDIGNALAMTAVTGNPYKFTWTGSLSTGELKFSCDKQSDWGGDWFLASSSGLEPSGSEEQMIFSAGGANPDNKWNITTAGTYTIELDQLQELVTITLQ